MEGGPAGPETHFTMTAHYAHEPGQPSVPRAPGNKCLTPNTKFPRELVTSKDMGLVEEINYLGRTEFMGNHKS